MGFSSDWLALREPADHAARDPALIAELSRWAVGKKASVVDLGCGSGSTFRALDHVMPDATWTLVDNDARLLEEAGRRTGAATRRLDIAADVAKAVEEADVVAASALFDLASKEWIDGFVSALPWTAAVYAALCYDGREVWSPAPSGEQDALAAFLDHQRGDKGFGPALGPDAAEYLAGRLARAGWTVSVGPSPWRLNGNRAPLIAALADGAAEAVRETGRMTDGALTRWREGRRAARRVIVGHVDVLALPPVKRTRPDRGFEEEVSPYVRPLPKAAPKPRPRSFFRRIASLAS